MRRSVRRRVAVASWRPSRDGRIYTRLAVDAGSLLAYVDAVRQRTGERVTVTHVVGAALARALVGTPEIRARIVLGWIVPYRGVDVGFASTSRAGTIWPRSRWSMPTARVRCRSPAR